MTATPERRKDIGIKLITGILMGVISIMLTVFFVGTYQRADKADTGMHENREEITGIKKDVEWVGEEVKEFKIEQRSFNTKVDLKLDRILAK